MGVCSAGAVAGAGAVVVATFSSSEREQPLLMRTLSETRNSAVNFPILGED